MTASTGWRTSSFSSNGSNCVEVRESADLTWLRDSKDHGQGPVLTLDARRWRDFLAEVADDLPSRNGAVRVHPQDDGSRLVEDTGSGAVLGFTRGEWVAFRSGVRAGEFGLAVETAGR